MTDSKITQAQLAKKAGLTQGAISQLIGYGYRAAPSTLKRLASGWAGSDAGVHLLAAHLLDEIQRAGRNPAEFDVRFRGAAVKTAPSRFDSDLAYLRETAERLPVLQALIHDLAELTRDELSRSESPKLAAAESRSSYSAEKK